MTVRYPSEQFSAGLDLLASSDLDLRTRLSSAWRTHLRQANSQVLSRSEYSDELKDRARNLDAWMSGVSPEGESRPGAAAAAMTVAEATQTASEIVAIATRVIGLDAVDGDARSRRLS